jgi:hypothetical protein
VSLVEDARRLADLYPLTKAGGRYFHDDTYCGGGDCPHIALPRIVAALEAAERVVRIHDENSRVVWDSPVFHEIDVLGDTLRGEEYTLEAAPMRDEEVPA